MQTDQTQNLPPEGATEAAESARPGLWLNALLRLSILYFLLETLLRPNDPRFARKLLPVPSFLGVGGATLLLPALHFGTGRWRRYPVWLDNLYLSIFWLDMVGNSFNLYNRYYHFDVIPHFHGAGAMGVVLQRTLRLPVLSALGLANGVHVLFEAGENYLDAFHGLSNVRGRGDIAKDLFTGLVGTLVYGAALLLLSKKGKAA